MPLVPMTPPLSVSICPVAEMPTPSTDVPSRFRKSLAARSAVVKRALAFIAENVTSGISASGVALALDIPLRTLEYRFRRELGRTVSAEIQERRLGAVERMLADRNVRIESIAQMCGYRSDVNLKKQFKKRFGLSMREWRKGVFALA